MADFEEESVLLWFSVEDGLDDYLDVCSLRMFRYGVQGTRLAVATLRHVLVMEAVLGSVKSSDSAASQHIQITSFVPEYGYPLCLQWVMPGVFTVGFDSGYLVSFDENASTIYENKFEESPLVSQQVDSADPTVLWLLFEKGSCISVGS